MDDEIHRWDNGNSNQNTRTNGIQGHLRACEWREDKVRRAIQYPDFIHRRETMMQIDAQGEMRRLGITLHLDEDKIECNEPRRGRRPGHSTREAAGKRSQHSEKAGSTSTCNETQRDLLDCSLSRSKNNIDQLEI